MQTMNDVWEAFAWSQARKNKLPSGHSRMAYTSLKTHDGSRTGWNTIVDSGYSAAVRIAEILYPPNPNSLLEDDLDRIHVQLSPKMTIKLLTSRL